ncbi:endonuclease/exonuclease/phosphatase family protein [Nitzschia inconspicua]|uniref:Endonuclease/exonuclease/phosphatase family protein n=1 Tax=Nitzschia inconspicua TaxID=303405 RepID=A0A9K3LYR9_9STRA|nr:endonuclease/exonuclease/phosphatase family protein [Nitzschia inconspicua]
MAPTFSSSPPPKRLKKSGNCSLSAPSAVNKDQPCECETSLKLLTFNTARCQPSKAAPLSWTQSDSFEALEKAILKEDPKPDVVALQEAPLFALGRNTAFQDYKLIGSRSSHAPFVALFVHRRWKAEQVNSDFIEQYDFEGLPAVMAVIDISESHEGKKESEENRRLLWVASVHLEPFAGGAPIRNRQLRALAEQARAAHVPLIIAGDTNMRVSEDDNAEIDLGLQDIWKLSGSNIMTKYTWNTRDELQKGGSFNQFYGSNTREYVARYDRLYAVNPAAASSYDGHQGLHTLSVKSFRLFADKPIGESKRHFLSDHFGIVAEVRIKWLI